MCVQVVESPSALDALREDWEMLHAADTHAGVFTSWSWMRAWLAHAEQWVALRVCAAQSRATLALAVFERPEHDVLLIAGTPLADHANFLCMPGVEVDALSAMARTLLDWPQWRRIKLREMLDPRLEAFVQTFRSAGRRYEILEGERTPCPYVALPPSWEEYRSGCLTKKPRNKINRVFRKLEALPDFRIERAAQHDYARQLSVLLRLWQARWGQRPASDLARLTAIFDACRQDGRLWLTTLHSGDTPVAASLGFVDRAHGTFSGYIGAFNADYAEHSPGAAVVVLAMQDAIHAGLRTFDFLRGAEQYKYETFRAATRFNENVTVARQPLRRVLGRALRRHFQRSG